MLQQLHLYKVVWKDWRIITRINPRKSLLIRGSENRKQMSSKGKNIKERKKIANVFAKIKNDKYVWFHLVARGY